MAERPPSTLDVLEMLGATADGTGGVVKVLLGLAGVAMVWLVRPLIPSADGLRFDEKELAVLAFIGIAAVMGPALILEGLAAYLWRAPARPSVAASTRFASFEEDERRRALWRRRLGFMVVGAAHAVAFVAVL